MGNKLITARIDEGLIDRFREKAKADGKSMSEILKLFIEGYLEGSIDPQIGGGEETAKKI